MSTLVPPTDPSQSATVISLHTTEQIWLEFGGRLRSFITRRVGSAADAEDILQDVFLRIHVHAGGIQRSERLTSWLFQVTRNAIIDYYRAPVRREQPEAVAGPEAFQRIEPAVQSQEVARDAANARKELANCLQPLLEQLPPHYREAVSLVDLSGLTHADAAARLGISVSGAKSRVQRGRRALQATLVQCCPVHLDHSRRIIDFQRPVSGCSGCAGQSGETAVTGEAGQPEGECCSPTLASYAEPASPYAEPASSGMRS